MNEYAMMVHVPIWCVYALLLYDLLHEYFMVVFARLYAFIRVMCSVFNIKMKIQNFVVVTTHLVRFRHCLEEFKAVKSNDFDLF